MPYPPEHKQRTRRRIVEVASRLFRRDGYHQTGVDRLMADAGLTRGGFYAHFHAKATLLVEALELAFAESEANLFERGLEEVRGDAWVRRAAARYLSLQHRVQPGHGCAVPALGAEVSRASRRVKRSFGQRVERVIARMAERLGGGAAGRAQAIRLLSTWAGALLISRAVDDGKLAREILDSARGGAH